MTGRPRHPSRPPAGAGTGAALAAVWAALPDPGPLPDHRLEAPTAEVPSAFDLEAAATAPVAAAVLAAAALSADRGRPLPVAAGDGLVICSDHALAASTGHVTVDGKAPPSWGPLSGRYRTADERVVQIHANFPHHAAGVAAHLGVAEDREAVTAAIATRRGVELEEELIDAGMICALYRSLDEWAAHPHAGAASGQVLIQVERLGDAPSLSWPDPTPTGRAGAPRALDGLRVLDCSRVLAGPACGQALAAHGADVLRVGAAHLPSVEAAVLATGFGKRNTFVDLRTTEGRDRLDELLAGADVVLDAYRPGALADRGLSAERAAELRPGVVVIEISAFGWQGPWAGRRGFDTIVQSTTGLALASGEAGGRDGPLHLPFPSLDYATGHLAAFAALGLLRHQRRRGGSWRARLSLLATRNWLVGLGGPWPFTPGPGPDVTPWLHTVDSPFGRLEAVRPVAGRWDTPPAPLGSSQPIWAQG